MKGHLELFENRLKAQGRKLPGTELLNMDAVFTAFHDALGQEIPFYDVQSGTTMADYYMSQFVRFVKSHVRS